MVRKPVDLDKCNYCAACGPVCPENCLDEHLFVDMSRCSYCNECVTTCPSQAIDLYRVEKYSLEFPALVLLDQPKVALPDDQTHIYNQDTLEQLFSSLVPLSIEETIGWTSSSCQFSTRANSGCTACLDACKHNALEQNQDGIAINYKRCVDCGACMASCPTGSLQYLHFTDQQFIEWFSTARPGKNTTIIIGKEQELHKLWWKKNATGASPVMFLEYPNNRALTAMHLLFLLSLGADRIILLDEPISIQDKPIASQVEIANTIFSTLFGGNERITFAPSTTLPATLQDVEPTPLKDFYHDFSFSNRRVKLGSTLSFLLGQSSTENAMLSREPFQPFGSVDCNAELCTHCGACLNECRIEALTTDSETLSLDHLAIQCVQCGTCVDVCPENALTLKPGLLLAPEFITPKELTRAEPIKCLECGKPFGTRKSYDRIVAILKAKSPDNMNEDVLEYCETCRVVKMFEAHQQ
jgi:ferredoxin